MKMSELIARYGDDNVQFQNLDQCAIDLNDCQHHGCRKEGSLTMDTLPADLRSGEEENRWRAGAAPYVEQANGFLVVSRFKLARPAVPPYRYDYSHTHYADLGDAHEHYSDLERGEIEGYEPVSILPTLNGVPLGSKVILRFIPTCN